MTKINKILMRGFKSFANRTELLFGERFNCILGPNGSGKSNVLDALCFVLGKSSARSLRAEKSANLVYNGGKKNKPAKEGEVSIFFDNTKHTFPTEDKQVKVTRIVRKDGQSIYKINDKRRTRHEILELLSVANIDPNGYNIILQGDIVRFVEMHPVQRRNIIEEISGISVYEDKKQSALRELTKVEAKLGESDIILKERKTYLKELKKERDQAIKYRDMADRIKQNKASYLKIKIDKKIKIHDGMHDTAEGLKAKVEKVNAKIRELKDKNKELKAQVEEISKEVERKGNVEQRDLNKEIQEISVKIAEKRSRIDMLERSLVDIGTRRENIRKNMGDTEQQMSDIEESLKSKDKAFETKSKEKIIIEKKIADFKKKHKIDDAGDIEKNIDELDKFIEQKQKEVEVLRGEQQELIRNQDQVSYRIQTADEKIQKVLEVEKENMGQLQQLKSMKTRFKTVTLDLNKCLDEDSGIASKLARMRKDMLEANENLSKFKARNAGLRSRIADNMSLKKIMENKSRFNGVLGTVSELGNVSSKYALALETAAGGRLKSIVVENDRVASDCIKYLKQNRLGTATFLPLNKLKAKDTDPRVKKLVGANGVEGLAMDLVEFEPRLRKVFQYLFANTLVVNDIDVARRIGIGEAKMVTLDGDMSEISGVMHGGFRKAKRSGYGFKEKELERDIKSSESRIAELEGAISAMDSRRAELDDRITGYRTEKGELEGEIIKIEKSLHLESNDMDASKTQRKDLNKELTRITGEVDHLTGTIMNVNRELADHKIKKQSLRSQVNALRSPTKIAELNAFEQQKDSLVDELVILEPKISSLRMQLENILGSEKQRSIKILKQLDQEEENFGKEKSSLAKEADDMQKTLKVLQEKADKFQNQFRELFQKRTNIGDDINANDNAIDKLDISSREAEHKANTKGLQLAQVKAELAGFNKEFEQYHGVELVTDRSEESLKNEIRKFENMVDTIGSVNMKALEIYEDVEKEYNRLIGKRDKLSQEQEDVIAMMDEIESKKKELFMTTYDVVNKHFKEIFLKLSTKGEASLSLEVPENPFEGGLSVRVRLSGNKFMDIRSLSGGEKTMTALAFIFAIQEHAPATFYVLDEVDAALDKKNSEKLSKLVKKYSDRSQYIMISHNDGVISEADNLYGVSMNEHGISQVISLRI